MIRAWTAGIIDGEGCIGIYQTRKDKITKRGVVQVGNTDFRMLQTLQNNFGGGIYQNSRRKRPRSKPIWNWMLVGWKTVPFLIKIEPYLVCKKEKARDVINFYKCRANR